MAIIQTLYKYAENDQTGRMVMLKEGRVSFRYLVGIIELSNKSPCICLGDTYMKKRSPPEAG
jgi:hypothetical protein